MIKVKEQKEKISIKQRIKTLLVKTYNFLKDWRTAISFLIAWMITNGWCYLFILFGSIFDIKWLLGIGTGYLAFLWLPCTPEKLITIPLALFIKKKLFKNKKGEENE